MKINKLFYFRIALLQYFYQLDGFIEHIRIERYTVEEVIEVSFILVILDNLNLKHFCFHIRFYMPIVSL